MTPSKPLSEAAARSRYRDQLRNARRPMEALEDIRAWIAPHMYGEVLQYVARTPALAQLVFRSVTPRSFRALYKYRVLDRVSLTRELKWMGAYLACHAELLVRYSSLVAPYSDMVLRGEFLSAFALLQRLENDIGLTFRGTLQQLALLQETEGLEAQKQYSAKARAEAVRYSVTAFVIHQASVRNEPLVTPGRFTHELRKALARSAVTEDVRVYVEYLVLGSWPRHREDLATILRHSLTASLVDAYEAFIYCCQAIIEAEDDASYPAVVTAVGTLAAVFNDRRLDTILSFLNDTRDARPLSHGMGAALNWALGDIEHAAEEAATTAGLSSISFADLLVAARLGVRPVVDGLGGRLVTHMQAVIARRDPIEIHVDWLLRLGMNYAGEHWSAGIKGFVASELSYIPFDTALPLSEGDRKVVGGMTYGGRAAVLTSPTRHVLDIELLRRGGWRSKHAAQLAADVSERVLSDYCESLALTAEPSHAIATLEATRIRAKRALYDSDLRVCASSATTLAASELAFVRNEGVRMRAYALLKDGDLGACVRFVAQQFVRNEQLRFLLPVRDLADSLSREARKALGGDPALAIVFDVYARYEDSAYDKYRRHAYQDVLTAAGVARPSELRTGALAVTPELVYYLKWVCVPEVMYASTVYEGSGDLQRERLAILRWLVEIDSDNREAYESETLERTRGLVIQERKAQIEQSKIQVDLEGFKRDAGRRRKERSVKEDFDRYVAYRTSGIRDIDRQLLRIALAHAREADLPKITIVLPDDEMGSLFSSLVLELRDAFVTSKAYGLDGFLSTRIRHGTLASELRSPLAPFQLATAFDDATRSYRPNTFWLSRLESATDAMDETLGAHFAEFAAEYDRLIAEIGSEWVQVRRDINERGMIDLSFTPTQLAISEALITPGADFDEFLDQIFGLLVGRILPGLDAIRLRISGEAKQRGMKALDTLLANVEADARGDLREIRNAIREAGTAIQRAFDRVASWFTLAGEISEEPLPLGDAMSIATDVAQRLYPNLQAIVDVGALGPVHIPGHHIPALVDIMLIVLSNVALRSGLGEHAVAHVTCERVLDGVRFEIVNDVAASVDRSTAEKTLSAIRVELGEERTDRALRTEGRTGFHKLHKIIAHELNGDPQLRFGFIGDARFSVTYVLPTRRIT